MIKVGIVVVTYNRLECLEKNVEALRSLEIRDDLSVRWFIVNNASTDGTSEWLDHLDDNHLEVITLEQNLGGSGGFYAGIKKACESGMDYIWGMDDDAYPEKEALTELFKVVDKFGSKACYWSNCDKDHNFSNEFKEVSDWMFVGFCIPSLIVNAVGYPRPDFFIYFDDIEYALRITGNGFPIYKVRDSLINHKDNVSNILYGKILGIKIQMPDVSDWRQYYFCRNSILRFKKYSKQYWYQVLVMSPRIIVRAVMLKPSQLKYVYLGLKHGRQGKSGIYIRP